MDDIEVSDSTKAKIHIGKTVFALVAECGTSRIINDVAKSIANQEPNKIKKIVIRIGGYALSCAATLGVDKALSDIEESVILGVRVVKAYKVYKEELEKEDGTESE